MLVIAASAVSGWASIATPPPMPADTTAIASAPAVKAACAERFCGGGAAGMPASPRWDRTGAPVRVMGSYGMLLLLGRVAPVVGLLLVR